MSKRIPQSITSILGAIFVTAGSISPANGDDEKLNILLIIGDDVGYSDLSPYGSEIATPNIASLAEEGVIFTNYHTPPACSPSRAQLHTGVDHHLVGIGRWDYAPYPGRDGIPGYEGYLTENNVTTAELLRDAGYKTYIAGKWHLGHNPESNPVARGFEESYVLLEGGANNYNNLGMSVDYPIANFTRNGEKVAREEGIHSNEYWTDELISMMDAGTSSDPFFAVLSFQTAHFPLQAPKEYIDKYMEHYSEGWQVARKQRIQAQQDSGLLPGKASQSEISIPPQPAWEFINPEDRTFEFKRMAIYAAMIEHHDFHIGRLVENLKSTDKYDNTVIIYVSDNGASVVDFKDGIPGPKSSIWFAENYNNAYENIGTASSNIGPGLGWGMMSTAPLAWDKLFVREGGIRVPMIIRHPMLGGGGRQSAALTQAMDVAATILDIAEVEHPGTTYKEKIIQALQGRSLTPILAGRADSIYADTEPVVIELLGNSAIMMGEWKLVRTRAGMRGSNNWELYNLHTDPGERIDVSDMHPDVLRLMTAEYQEYAEQNNIVPIDDNWTPFPGQL